MAARTAIISTGFALDSKTVFFTVPSVKKVEPEKLPVPETGLLLVPLAALAVLAVLAKWR